jgi:hypothetical protein
MAGVELKLSGFYVGCVSPLDARYASPARKSAETGQIS